MRELQLYVVPEVKADWEKLAYAMEYDTPEVKAIRNDGKDSDDCCIKLFEDWLDSSHGCTPKTWGKLLERIKEVSKLHAAEGRIKEKLGFR